jgi:hypothetical protein
MDGKEASHMEVSATRWKEEQEKSFKDCFSPKEEWR